MRPELWKRVSEIFDQALELPAGERGSFLERNCEREPVLRAQVERLLAADLASTTPIDTPVPRRLSMGLEGSRLGAYRLERMIHCGGMGNIYVASRADEEFERRVAIKVVRRVLLDEASRRRFRRERQMLAHLEHPNIARLYDGGTTSDGQPYIVMEFVDGEPITEHCRRSEPRLEGLLKLFSEVCSGVDHAHRRGLIHRDLKPANVLVDGGGRPKLVDFGIGRLLEPDAEVEPAAAASAMSPGYASPEQVAGLETSPASDVYSLGVLLEELLTSRGPAADLRAIIARARAGEPGERYPTAGALAGDLDSYLAGRPVSAAGSAPLYRVRKFLGRNADRVSATLIALGLLAAVMLVADRGARLVAKERHELSATSADLVELLSLARWKGAQDGALPAADLLEAVEQRVQTDLTSRPRVQAELLESLADVYLEGGHRQDARRLVERSLALRRRELGPEHPEVGEALHNLAVVNADEGRLELSRALFAEALAIRRAYHGEKHPQVAETVAALGRLYWQAGDLPAAEAELRAALGMWETTCGLASPAAVSGLADLAALLRQMGRLEEASGLTETADTLSEAILDEHDPQLAEVLQGRAHLHMARGELGLAEALHRRALERLRASLGDYHPTTARAMAVLARCIGERGRYPEAIELFDRALLLMEEWNDGETAEFATVLNNRAVVYGYQGRHAEAESELGRVLELRRRLLGPSHPFVAQASYSLGRVLHAQGRLEEALRLYSEASAGVEAALPEGHPARLYPLVARAHALVDRGHSAAAEALLRSALPRMVATHGEDHWRVAEAKALMAASLLERAPEEARALLNPSLVTLERQRGAAAPCSRRARSYLASLDREAAGAGGTVQARRFVGG
jgi:serine/threonine-protein kinase